MCPSGLFPRMAGWRSTMALVREGGEPLDPDERREVSLRQTQVALRSVAIGDVANMASVVLTAVFVLPPGTFRSVWAILMVGALGNSCRRWSPWVTDPARPAPPAGRRLLVLDVLPGTIGYTVLGAWGMTQVDGATKVILAATIVGVIGAGAVALATVRPAALMWVICTLAGLATGFIRAGSSKVLVEVGQVVLYAVSLCTAVEYLAWSFEQRYRAEQRAARALETVSLVLDDFEGGARDWLWRTDPTGILVSASARFAESAGRSVEDLEQSTIVAVAGGDPALDAALAANRAFRDVVVPVTVAGEARWWSLSGTRLPDGSWRGVGSDITESHQHAQAISDMANYDALTGLANRHRLHSDLQTMIAVRQPHQQIRFAILDLDNFKAVNDTVGHPIGDRVLIEVAERLRLTVPADHTCARLGGDEFAIIALVDDPDQEGDAEAFLDSIFAEPYLIDGTRLEIRGSIGSAMIDADTSDSDEVMMLADLALYSAKDQGRGRVRAYQPAMRTAAEERVRSHADLSDAVAADQFEVYFQPLISSTDCISGFEALARWQHPVRGWIPPDSFIPLAEETGLIVPLGEQITDQALAMAAKLPHHVRVGINVSAVQLLSVGFVERFGQAIERHRVSPDRIDVEVTESAAIETAARSALFDLRDLGCGIAIDDFGTGYSSFAALHDLPITELKIDRAFIARLGQPEDTRARAIVEAIVNVAAATGLACVAEGVETAEQLAIVRSLGDCIVQGYIESRPMPPAEVETYLVRRGT